MRILVLNSGSSSIKYEVFDEPGLESLATGLVERIGESRGRIVHRQRDASGDLQEHVEEGAVPDHRAGIERLLRLLAARGAVGSVDELMAIGHRVVHGGEAFRAPTLVDAGVLETIRAQTPLAPLHNPANVAGIEVSLEHCPEVPQVAVFDTAFHQSIPSYAYHYAVPYELYERFGVRRYGFHGTSHAFVAARAAELLGRPLEELALIVLHLGAGASAAAIDGGRSVETSMGMTPLEGLVMATRCGDIDPAVVLHLVRTSGRSADEIEAVLNGESGLEGVCGARDMRDVLERVAGGDERAELALEMYAHRVRKYIGAYLAVLGRLDAVVFTAGVGENSPPVRARCCRGLEGLGIAIDGDRNEAPGDGARDIGAAGSAVRVLVVPTDEERRIAEETAACVRAQSAGR